jgi:hypothetical protein
MQLISNFLNKIFFPFYNITCSLSQLDEIINHMKTSNFLKFEAKGLQEKRFLFEVIFLIVYIH